MGCTHWQILTRIKLKLALPEILLGSEPDDHVRAVDAGDHRAGRHPRSGPRGLHRADQGRSGARSGRGPCRRLHRDHRRPADRRPGPPGRGRGWVCEEGSDEPERAFATLPCWQGEITAEPLTGGLSNESWMVTDDAGAPCRPLWPRLPVPPCHPRARSDDGARRPCGRVCARRSNMPRPASWSRPSSRPGPGTRRICAPTPERVGRPAAAISTTTCRAHISGPGFMFWVFHVIRDYARTPDRRQRHAPTSAAASGAGRGTARRRRCRCRSSSATTTCCPPISSMTATGSG